MTYYNDGGTIGDEIMRQSQDMGWENFICESCKHYKGGCICGKGVFIAFVGANMKSCIYAEQSIKCPHCGGNV